MHGFMLGRLTSLAKVNLFQIGMLELRNLEGNRVQAHVNYILATFASMFALLHSLDELTIVNNHY